MNLLICLSTHVTKAIKYSHEVEIVPPSRAKELPQHLTSFEEPKLQHFFQMQKKELFLLIISLSAVS